MNTIKLLKISLLLMITILAYPVTGFTENSQSKQFHIQLPKNIDPENMTYSYNNCYVTHLGNKGSQEQWDYYLDLGLCSNTKLLLYIPGYDIISYEFDDNNIIFGVTWQPELRKLPNTVTLSGQLVDSGNIPLPGELIRVSYHFREAMRYYGYGDGMVDQLYLGTAKTDENGNFSVDVPFLQDDPFIVKNKGPHFYTFYLLSPDKNRFLELLDPFFVQVKDAHEKPLTLKLYDREESKDFVTY